jgi:hypothetical protein
MIFYVKNNWHERPFMRNVLDTDIQFYEFTVLTDGKGRIPQNLRKENSRLKMICEWLQRIQKSKSSSSLTNWIHWP